MSPQNTIGAPAQRRLSARIWWILLAMLATVLVVGILIQRGSPTTTILVTDLQDNEDAAKRIAQIQKTRGHEDVDLVLFVRSVADPTPQTDKAAPAEDWIWLSSRDLVAHPPGQLPWLVVTSSKNAADVQKTLKSTSSARVAALEDGKIRMESQILRPGLLSLMAWALGLLVIGALFGRILLPRTLPQARRAGPPDMGVRPPPDAEHRLRKATRQPEAPPPARGHVDLTWARADADAIPPHGGIDLRRFHKRSTVDSWTPQCPYCAAFDVQTWDKDGSSDYRCSWCAEEWQVRAGEPWPTVVIRPRHRRAD